MDKQALSPTLKGLLAGAGIGGGLGYGGRSAFYNALGSELRGNSMYPPLGGRDNYDLGRERVDRLATRSGDPGEALAAKAVQYSPLIAALLGGGIGAGAGAGYGYLTGSGEEKEASDKGDPMGMNEQLEKVASSFGEYFVPRFIKECAARGIEFDNEEDLRAALETCVMLDQCEKTARANGTAPVSPKQEAAMLLKQAMAEMVGAPQVEQEKQAAALSIRQSLLEAVRAGQQEPQEQPAQA